MYVNYASEGCISYWLSPFAPQWPNEVAYLNPVRHMIGQQGMMALWSMASCKQLPQKVICSMTLCMGLKQSIVVGGVPFYPSLLLAFASPFHLNFPSEWWVIRVLEGRMLVKELELWSLGTDSLLISPVPPTYSHIMVDGAVLVNTRTMVYDYVEHSPAHQNRRGMSGKISVVGNLKGIAWNNSFKVGNLQVQIENAEINTIGFSSVFQFLDFFPLNMFDRLSPAPTWVILKLALNTSWSLARSCALLRPIWVPI